MVTTCCVPNCSNRGNTVTMHRFPKPNNKIFKKWIESIGNPVLQNEDPRSVYENHVVCDIHFSVNHRMPGCGGSNLRDDSVPTLNLPDMDPLSLSFLEGMDQVEVVIDSEEEDNVNKDVSTDEEEEQDGGDNEPYVAESCDETSSMDGIMDTQENAADSSGTEEVPLKKLKISNVISLNPNSKKALSSEVKSDIINGAHANKKSKDPVEHESKNASSSNIETGSTLKPTHASILLNVLTKEKLNTRVDQQNKSMAPHATSTPANVQAMVVPGTALVVPGSSNVPLKGVVQSAASRFDTGSDLNNMVLIPNQAEFVLEEDYTRINPCFVPGCKIYKNEQMYAFGVPKNPVTLQLWDMCINNKEHKLNFNHVICYKHFAQEDVIHNIKLVKQNGKDVALDDPSLRKGALPGIKFWKNCCVPNCKKTSGRMYTFPVTNKPNLHLWLYLIKNIELKKLSIRELLKHRVCELHFEADSFDKNGDLENAAAPTLFLPESSPPILPQKCLEVRKDFSVKTCAFENCNSQGISSKLMFSFPKTFDRILAWLGACNRVDLIGMNTTDTLQNLANIAVCEDHFECSDFENSMMNKLRDGAVPRARTSLATVDGAEKRPQSIKLTPILLESCIYKGCKNKPTKDQPFFFFPAELDRYKEWMKACGYKCFGTHFYAYRICPNHFPKPMFDKSGLLLDTAVPFTHPDPNLIVSPVVHPKKHPNLDLTTQKFRSEGRIETVLNFRDNREVVVIQDTRTIDAQKEMEEEGDLICAVRNCVSMYKLSEAEYHRFPSPERDAERFEIWLKLVANSNLVQLSKEEICRSYMVCKRHFEKGFYSKRIPTSREKVLSNEAVPTLNLPADSCLLKEWDHYKDRLKKYLDALAAVGPEEKEDEEEDEKHEPVVTSWVTTETVRLSDLGDKTRCVLEKDRLSFPGMGCKLLFSTNDKKKKFPYNVYRARAAGYGLTGNIEIGENVHIHTAIIIDDDDECERQVLQQLVDRRKIKTLK